jgi:hypothetical protein
VREIQKPSGNSGAISDNLFFLTFRNRQLSFLFLFFSTCVGGVFCQFFTVSGFFLNTEELFHFIEVRPTILDGIFLLITSMQSDVYAVSLLVGKVVKKGDDLSLDGFYRRINPRVNGSSQDRMEKSQ